MPPRASRFEPFFYSLNAALKSSTSSESENLKETGRKNNPFATNYNLSSARARPYSFPRKFFSQASCERVFNRPPRYLVASRSMHRQTCRNPVQDPLLKSRHDLRPVNIRISWQKCQGQPHEKDRRTEPTTVPLMWRSWLSGFAKTRAKTLNPWSRSNKWDDVQQTKGEIVNPETENIQLSICVALLHRFSFFFF